MAQVPAGGAEGTAPWKEAAWHRAAWGPAPTLTGRHPKGRPASGSREWRAVPRAPGRLSTPRRMCVHSSCELAHTQVGWPVAWMASHPGPLESRLQSGLGWVGVRGDNRDTKIK